MAARVAYPPVRIEQSQLVSADVAQHSIASYLERSLKDASLHPGAILKARYHYSKNGTTSDEDEDEAEVNNVDFSQSGPQGGLTLHFLRRIEAGLRGEDLAAQSREELKALFSDEMPDHPMFGQDGTRSMSKREQNIDRVAGWTEAVKTDNPDETQEITDMAETVDADQFALEQDVVDDEIGADLEGMGNLQREPKVRLTQQDKLARKAAKKAQRQEMKKAKREATAR